MHVIALHGRQAAIWRAPDGQLQFIVGPLRDYRGTAEAPRGSSQEESHMRKLLAQLDPVERKVLLYLADLSTALFMSALATCTLKFVGDFI
jgi:hypothetical protein